MILTSTELKKRYDGHYWLVLRDYLDPLPREGKKGERQKYNVIKPLPSEGEYAALKINKFTSDVSSLVEDAFSDFSDLAGELQDWYDALPESFQSGDKGSMLEEAQSALENLSAPDVDGGIGKIPVVHYPMLKVSSRSDRRDEAIGCLQDVIAELREITESEDYKIYTKEQHEDMDCLADELENAVSDARRHGLSG